MKSIQLKALLVLLLMLAAFAGAHALRPTARLADTRERTDLEVMFPKSFGAWQVDDRMPVQLISPDTQAMLNKIYNQTLSRTYVNPQGERIMLSVAYGGDQSDGTRAHRPEVCYPAQGFEVLSSQVSALPLPGNLMGVRQLVARLGGRVEPITYWVVVGERTALSGTQQKFAQLAYSLRGVVPDGTLLRVSSIDTNSSRAYAVHAAFIRDLNQAIKPGLRPRFFGLSAPA